MNNQNINIVPTGKRSVMCPRSEALNVAQTVADEYKAMSFKLVPAPFARKNGKIWTATLRARRSFDWNDRL